MVAPAVISDRALRRISSGMAIFGLVVGAVVLLGWVLGDETLKRIVPLHGEVSVKTNTALGLTLAAASLLLWDRGRAGRDVSRACAAVVTAIGAATLFEYAFGVKLGLDQLLFHEPSGAVHTSSPNRMAANTAFCFLMLGPALLLVDRRPRGRCPSTALALVVAAVASLALVGIAMGVTTIPGVSQQARMALMTAITFEVLAVGCACAAPDSSAMRRFLSAGAGGLAVRRLLPVAIVLPVALGGLRLVGERQGLFRAEVGTWLLIVTVMICVGGLVWRLAGSIERGDQELRGVEQQLRRAVAEAERASAAKSQFLSSMSHELRTPLNAILGFGQLLEFDELSADQRESVDHIVGAGRHLLGLVNEILDIARIESGKLTLSLESVRLPAVLEEARSLLGPLGLQRGIAIDVDASALEPWQLRADHQRLRQIILNLLSNAIKYNHEGGWVRLSCERRPEGMLAVVVADGGPGIDPADHERMFAPFERIGEQAAEGTGLGLALARHLAELMDGSLDVHSAPGEGSRFVVTLPLSTQLVEETTAAPVARPTDPPAAAVSGDLLYIEDNPANIALVESLCARMPGLALRTAASAHAGLAGARRKPPDLILLDLHLPDMHGREVLERLRSQATGAHIPVLVLTADATPGEERKLRRDGADGYLTKPLDMALLQAEIVRLLVGRRPPARPILDPVAAE